MNAAEDLLRAGTKVVFTNKQGRLLTGVVQNYKDAAVIVLTSDGRTWTVPVRWLGVAPSQ